MRPQELSYKYLPAGINNFFETNVKKGLGRVEWRGREREEEEEKERQRQPAVYLKRKWKVQVAGDLITVCLTLRN